MRAWATARTTIAFVMGVAAAIVGATVLSSTGAGAGTDVSEPGLIDATFVPIKPCRLFDLRTSEFGLRTAPLAPGETLIQQVKGEQGNCNLPDDVVGVSMNVTIVEPTAASHLTVYPANSGGRPLSSNLNWVAGQAPTANKVDVAVSGSQVPGRIVFYNAFGTVYVIADVVGYYTDASLDALKSTIGGVSREIPKLSLGDGPLEGLHYKVTATATVDLDTAGVDAGTCTIEPGVVAVYLDYTMERVAGHPVEFSDEGIPASQMRIPITVVQVFRFTVPRNEYGIGYIEHVWFDLDCTPSSGAFDVLDDSVIWEIYPARTRVDWR